MINLTQHAVTSEQQAQGVTECPENIRLFIRSKMTFEVIPTEQDLERRAADIAAALAPESEKDSHVMIGGAPFFMSHLESALRREGFVPHYAFSQRRSVEALQPDGSVQKTAVFIHEGFIPPYNKK